MVQHIQHREDCRFRSWYRATGQTASRGVSQSCFPRFYEHWTGILMCELQNHFHISAITDSSGRPPELAVYELFHPSRKALTSSSRQDLSERCPVHLNHTWLCFTQRCSLASHLGEKLSSEFQILLLHTIKRFCHMYICYHKKDLYFQLIS